MGNTINFTNFSSLWNPPIPYNEAKVTQKPSKWEEDQLYFLDINSH